MAASWSKLRPCHPTAFELTRIPNCILLGLAARIYLAITVRRMQCADDAIIVASHHDAGTIRLS